MSDRAYMHRVCRINKCGDACYGLSPTCSLLSVLRRPILPMDEAMLPMRLLVLPPSLLRFMDRPRDRRCLGDASLLSSSSPARVRVAITSREMPPRQNGQVGSGWDCVAGLGLVWQQSASVHAAHIWCPHSRTSMLQACSKQMLHTSASSLLACARSRRTHHQPDEQDPRRRGTEITNNVDRCNATQIAH
jgi:hypothetical protein